MLKKNILLLFSALIFFIAASAAIVLKDEFLSLLSVELGFPKVKVDLSPQQAEILAFSNSVVAKIPADIQKRIKKIELLDNSLPKNTRHNIEAAFRQLNFKLIETGDLKLSVEIIEQDESTYLLCAVEVIKTKNRIFEISDQLQKKTR